MMTHRKAHSHSESEGGRVPFSWEEKPGIPKFFIPNNKSCAKMAEISTTSTGIKLPLRKSSSSHFHSPGNTMMSCGYYNRKISPPPPPPLVAQPAPTPSRSSSRKGLWKQHQIDPFAAAIKECTKNIVSQGMGSGSKNYMGSKERNSKVIFSCKKSCDVREDNLVMRPVNLPRLPKARNKGQAW